jgi:hypothetical protein
MECPVVELGFEGLSAGSYVSTQFRQKYGVRISASSSRGAITVNGPRVFDSANQNGGDAKLMSPNSGCGGAGYGAGGAPASVYKNCDPLGNVLLVQINTTDKIVSNIDRSYIIFDFDEPIKLVAATFLESTSEKNAGMEVRTLESSTAFYGMKPQLNSPF